MDIAIKRRSAVKSRQFAAQILRKLQLVEQQTDQLSRRIVATRDNPAQLAQLKQSAYRLHKMCKVISADVVRLSQSMGAAQTGNFPLTQRLQTHAASVLEMSKNLVQAVAYADRPGANINALIGATAYIENLRIAKLPGLRGLLEAIAQGNVRR